MNKYRYLRGGGGNSETVEFDIRDDQYVTTCVVDVRALLVGLTIHPCADGGSRKLSDQELVSVLEVVKRERNAIRFSGKIKTLAGWQGSGLYLSEYLTVGDVVDKALVREHADCLPPHRMTGKYLQVGEPSNDEPDYRSTPIRFRPTYSTFQKQGSRWVYLGDCFTDDTTSRAQERDAAGLMLWELKKGGADA
jgi:hypothetical protein